MLGKIIGAWALFTTCVGLTCLWATMPPEKSVCEVLVQGSFKRANAVRDAGGYKDMVRVGPDEWCLN